MPQVVRIPAPSVAFPTLQVSSRDAKTLEIVSDAHVLDTLEHYQEFIRDHKECVDRKLWRKVRSRHGVRAYRERRKAAARRERFEKSGSSSVPSITSPRQGLKKTCRLCCDRVCSRCRVTKHVGCITALDDQDVVVSTSMSFCTRCIHRASHVSAHFFSQTSSMFAHC
ncbi:hypothetical protein PybrP1_009373 [[Pythium] brassicae (nom. inval.)]|nr:hypothetical protein PybrP1_009373 [[Pythium] brassicae (nom. inval.)]